MRKYFGDTYHGGIMYMHLWGEHGYHTPPIWDWSKSVPKWLYEHAFRRLDTIEGYNVNLEVDGSTLEYLREHNPELVSRLRDYIGQGKLEIVDGTYAQPYSLLQSGESCVRQLYYGQKASEEVLGERIKTYFKQEPFFFPQLAQLLTKSGFKHAVVRAHINHYGDCSLVKMERVQWTSPDGTSIDAVPNYIDSTCHYDLDYAMERLPSYEDDCRKRGFESMFFTLGLDVAHDMEYIPTARPAFADKLLPREIDLFYGPWINKGISDERIGQLIGGGYEFVPLSRYFECEPTSDETVELESDDFVFKYRCGQLADSMVRANKEAEHRIYDGEVMASFVRMAGGPNLLTEDSRKAMWTPTLLAQNHDFHAAPTAYSYGVSASPYNTALDFTRESSDRANALLRESVDYLAASVDTSSASGDSRTVPIVVFNQLLGDRRSTADAEVVCPKGFGESLRLTDGSNEIPSDVSILQRYADGGIYKALVTFNAELPSLGYKTYYLESCDKIGTDDYVSTGDAGCLEDDILMVVFGRDGLIESIRDKSSGFEYLDTRHFKGNELTADFGNGFVRGVGEASTIRRGKIVSTRTSEGKIGDLNYRTTYRFHHGEGRIDCETVVDFDVAVETKSANTAIDTNSMNDHLSKLRVTFNPSFAGSLFTDQPFSVYPSGEPIAFGYNFGCYTDGEHAITLTNSGNIAYFQDPASNTRLSMVLAGGDKSWFYGALLLSGVQVFRYSVFLHGGDWKTGRSVRKSLEVSHPPLVKQTHVHTGALPASCSFVRVPEDNVVASACYPDEGGIWLRLWETGRQATISQLDSGFARGDMEETDMLGEPLTECDPSSVRFAPWEVKTLRIHLSEKEDQNE